MNYILEFLKAFDEKKGCCVSPLNENEDPAIQQRRAELLAAANSVVNNEDPNARVVTSPSQRKYRFAQKKDKKSKQVVGISVSPLDGGTPWTIDATTGQAISAQNQEAQNLGAYFGAQQGEPTQGEEAGVEQAQVAPTPEQVEQQQLIARVERISGLITKSLEKLTGNYGNPEARCRLRLSANMSKLKNDSENDRELQAAYRAARTGKSCEAVKLLKQAKRVTYLSTWDEVQRALFYNYQNTLLTQLRNIRQLSLDSIEVAFGAECKDEQKRKKKKECITLGAATVPKEESDAAAKNFERAAELMSVIGERELTEAEKIELVGLVEFTNDGKVLIRGVTTRIAFKDRNRQFYDIAMAMQPSLLGRRKFKVHQMENYSSGDENNLRGTMKENLLLLAGLVQQYNGADGDPEMQDEIETSIKSVFSDLKDVCRYLGMANEAVQSFEEGKSSVPAESLEALQSLTDGVQNLDNCSDLTPQLYSELAGLMTQVKELGNPMVFHSGKVTGEGIRRDVTYAYATREEAVEAFARVHGITPEEADTYVQEKTVGEMLDESQSLSTALSSDRLTGPGAPYDRNKVMYAIPEGLKTSITGGDAVKHGSGAEAATLEAATNPKTPAQKAWLERTCDTLRIPKNARKAAQARLSKLNKELQEQEKAILSLGPKVVNGKKESPHAYLEQIKNSVRSADAEDNKVYTTATALQKAYKTKPINPKRIEELKKELVVACQNSTVEKFYRDATNPRAPVADRHAVAMLATMPGTTGERMLTTVYKEGRTRGSTGSRISFDHNESACSLWRDWIKNPNSAEIRVGEAGPSKYFGVSIISPDGRRVTTAYEGRTANLIGNRKNTEYHATKVKLNNSVDKSNTNVILENILRIQTFLLRKLLT